MVSLSNHADSAISTFNVFLRFASLPNVVDAQIDEAMALAPLQRCPTTVVDGDAERALWREHASRLWNATGAIVRASWLPADVAATLAELERIAESATAVELIGRAGVGAGLIRIDAGEPAQAQIISQLRETAAFGNVVIVRGSAALKALVDVWGPQGDRERLLGSLKRAFDPNGVLNAGRGPL